MKPWMYQVHLDWEGGVFLKNCPLEPKKKRNTLMNKNTGPVIIFLKIGGVAQPLPPARYSPARYFPAVCIGNDWGCRTPPPHPLMGTP